MKQVRLVKLRVTGAPEDVAATVEDIQFRFPAADISQPYPNRNRSGVRMYITLVVTQV